MSSANWLQSFFQVTAAAEEDQQPAKIPRLETDFLVVEQTTASSPLEDWRLRPPQQRVSSVGDGDTSPLTSAPAFLERPSGGDGNGRRSSDNRSSGSGGAIDAVASMSGTSTRPSTSYTNGATAAPPPLAFIPRTLESASIGSTVSVQNEAGRQFMFWGLDMTPDAVLRIQRLLMVRHVFNTVKAADPTFGFRAKPYCSLLFDEKWSRKELMPFENACCNVALQRLYLLADKKVMFAMVRVSDPLMRSLLSDRLPVSCVLAVHKENSGGHHFSRETKVETMKIQREARVVPDNFQAFVDDSTEHWELGGIQVECVLRQHYRDELE